MRDIADNIRTEPALNPQAVGSTGDKVGAWIDRQGFDSVAFSLQATTGVEGLARLEQSPDASTNITTVADEDLHLADGFSAYTGVAGVQKVGYRGNDRYVRLVFNATAAAGEIGAQAIKGNPATAKTSQA